MKRSLALLGVAFLWWLTAAAALAQTQQDAAKAGEAQKAAATYEEVALQYPTKLVQVEGKQERVEDKTKPPTGRLTKTLRGPRGSKDPELLRVEAVQFPPKNIKIITSHQRGELHGPYQFYKNDELVREGQYERGLREGVWIERQRGATYTIRWHEDRPDGLYEKKSADGNEQILFKGGLVVGKDGVPEPNPLLDFLKAKHAENSSEFYLAEELRKPAELGVQFATTPLVDAVAFLQDAYRIPFMIDHLRVPHARLPISADCAGLDLYTTLAVTFAPYGLACHYHHGVLWLTTKEHARGWRDPTGVSEVKPPPASVLAKEWDRILAIPVESIDSPLATILDGISRDLKIQGEIDASRVAGEAFKVTANIRGQSLRDALGILLYNTKCRCKLENGKLVILPPESK